MTYDHRTVVASSFGVLSFARRRLGKCDVAARPGALSPQDAVAGRAFICSIIKLAARGYSVAARPGTDHPPRCNDAGAGDLERGMIFSACSRLQSALFTVRRRQVSRLSQLALIPVVKVLRSGAPTPDDSR